MGLQKVLSESERSHFRVHSIAMPKMNNNAGTEGSCSTANDRTRAVIDRSYRMGTCRAERELEKKIKIQKLKIRKEKQK
jgi:hypothetical protein